MSSKYEQGDRICSIAQFEASACKWFKWRGQTIHREFLASLQYRTIKGIIDGGLLYEAKLKHKEVDNGT